MWIFFTVLRYLMRQSLEVATRGVLWKNVKRGSGTEAAVRISTICRSSCQEVFCKKGVLKNFAKFMGKQLCRCLFFNKLAGMKPTTLLKKRLWHMCFPLNLAKFLRTPFHRTLPRDCFWIPIRGRIYFDI